jgi:AcrR family transcriptional regulator
MKSLSQDPEPAQEHRQAPAKVGLRERKKARTRAAIREHAMRLFHEQGYGETTVEQIAEAAEVAQSTVFRYFPTKEDLVMTDDYDAPLLAAFRAQPKELSPVAAMRAAYREVFDRLPPEAVAAERERMMLVLSVPELRARTLDEFVRGIDEMTGVLAERVGLPSHDKRARNLAGAITGVAVVSMLSVANDPDADFIQELDDALIHLDEGLPL